jgi:7-keto-8-aminopelargonate synthetase-like enzyme
MGKESALVFTTGYQVNLATCAALLSNKQSVAFIDRNVHASLYDGVTPGPSRGRQARALQAQRRRIAGPSAGKAGRPAKARS